MRDTSGKDAVAVIINSDGHEDASTHLLELFSQFWGRGALHASVGEALTELSEEQHHKLWQLLCDAFNSTLTIFLSSHDGMQNADHEEKNESILLCILRLAVCSVRALPSPKDEALDSNTRQLPVPLGLLQLIVVVGGMLEVVEGDLCSVAVTLCEEWSLQQLPETETFGRQLFSVLLRISLEHKAKKGEVKRVYQQRRWMISALSDRETAGEDGHLESLISSLTSCFLSPLYLSLDDGLKFLSLVMTHRCCLAPCHAAVKNMLPRCNRSQAAKLGQVYCRAWRNIGHNDKQALEEDCLQDLMYRYLFVSPNTASHLSGTLFAFLHSLHTHQKLPAFATMLQRKYNPFLWRNLSVANGFVRANAIAVLCDAYPLEDLSVGHEERENHLNRAHTALTAALTDTTTVARVAAIQGVCRILNTYWLALPKATIQSWFSLLLTKLAYDASSAQVRVQVVKGVTQILDCQDALPFLKQCLPQLKSCFDDANTAVRIAMVRLMLKLHGLKLIKYWNVVPVPHLLHRLAVDGIAVCKLITRLLATAFLPIHRDDKDLVERSLALIGEERAASRVFYQHVSQGLDVGSVVRLMLLLYRALRGYLLHQQALADASGSAADKPREKRSKKVPASNKENAGAASLNCSGGDTSSSSSEDEEETDSPLSQPGVVCGLLDSLVVLWTANAHKLSLPHNSKWLLLLQRKVARGLPLLSSTFRGHCEVSRTLLHLASFLPRSLVPTLAGHCISRLRSLTDDRVLKQEEDADYLAYVNALCNWNRADDVLDLVEDWLAAALVQDNDSNFLTGSATSVSPALNTSTRSGRRLSRDSARRSSDSSCSRSGGRVVRFTLNASHTEPRPEAALALLSSMLLHRLNKLALLQKSRPALRRLVVIMARVQVCLDRRLQPGTTPDSVSCPDSFLPRCLREYLCLVTVLHRPPPAAPPADQPGEERRSERPRRGASNRTTPDTVQDEAAEQTVEPEFDAVQHYLSCISWAERTLLPCLSCPENSGGDCSLSDVSSLSNVSCIASHSADRKRKLGTESGSTASVVKTSVLAQAAVNVVIKMASDTLATAVASPSLLTAAVRLTQKVLEKDVECSVLPTALQLAFEAQHYLRPYGAKYDRDTPPAMRGTQQPDVKLVCCCITALLRRHGPNNNKGVLHRKLSDTLSCLHGDGFKLRDVSRHAARTCLERLADAPLQSDEAVSESSVGLLVGIFKARVILAEPFTTAILHVCQQHTQTVASRVTALRFLEFLNSEPGKLSKRSLSAALAHVDQQTHLLEDALSPLAKESHGPSPLRASNSSLSSDESSLAGKGRRRSSSGRGNKENEAGDARSPEAVRT